VIVMVKLLAIMGYTCHVMDCGFVMIGRTGYKKGLPSWLEFDSFERVDGTVIQGPYTASDTEGGDNVLSIYIAGFYFCLTTMTSVGYGDISTYNNYERCYVIFLEFCGAIVFASIIAAITSVVTSMDMNARKTAEQLDAVASFVEMRAFPNDMARRIRRHFRHFYSLKSAIDESKIFSELSSSLRRDVSEYLIRDLMGDNSIFMTMSPTMWPSLLPLLRPMRFELGEVVCEEGEECTEMYVVLQGRIVASTRGEDGEPSMWPRVITTGGNVNVLHVLGVWEVCIETAYANLGTETYAVSARDFQGLFSAKADRAAFERMQRQECRRYVFDRTFPDAPTSFGRPLRLKQGSNLDDEMDSSSPKSPSSPSRMLKVIPYLQSSRVAPSESEINDDETKLHESEHEKGLGVLSE